MKEKVFFYSRDENVSPLRLTGSTLL